MEFKQLENNKSCEAYLVRLNRGEELVSTLKQFCATNNIKLGQISGVGATDKFEIGLFNPTTKKYQAKVFEFPTEITSLTGNISTMNGETYLHLHGCFSDESFQTLGGHLNSAVISATAEIIILKFNDQIDRYFDENIGLNLWQLN